MLCPPQHLVFSRLLSLGHVSVILCYRGSHSSLLMTDGVECLPFLLLLALCILCLLKRLLKYFAH